MYIYNGKIKKQRPYGLWMIPALMWFIFNFIALFFQSMCNNKRKRPSRGTSFRSFQPGECESKGG